MGVGLGTDVGVEAGVEVGANVGVNVGVSAGVAVGCVSLEEEEGFELIEDLRQLAIKYLRSRET